jgi:two-component system, cell cycle response regulator
LTLRARLTLAFLAVVLGPVLLGTVFVATTVTAVNQGRANEVLDRAGRGVRAALDADCEQLRAVAVLGDRPEAARRAVRQGLAGAVRLEDASGNPVGTGDGAPPYPWALCGTPAGGGPYTALAARVELRSATGTLLGFAYAVRAVDGALLAQLRSAASGAEVSYLSGGPGRWRRVAGPLPLVVSVPAPEPGALVPLLALVALLAMVAAVVVASWLARGTTRPLAELAVAVERVGRGDLTVRVPVRGHDEVGRLATRFNAMTRELQSYVAAVTASRDQLRGHLAVLGDTLAGTHDLDRILDVIVQTACAATGAASGAVLLHADGVVRGPGVEVPLGDGLVGSVALTGVACRGRVERDGPVLAPGEATCRTYMAVPFRAPESVRGVLALYDRLGDDEFDDEDLVTLRTFAGQAAVAVQNVRLHEEARRLSHTDPLTGLYNRRTLTESLRREVERASRFGHTLCVLALDLDRFKEVNDSYGHAGGDAVLVEFARRVRGVIREVDLAFRSGGEEFVVLLPETDAAGGAIVAQRLGAAIRGTPVSAASRAIPVTVSIGIAVFPQHGSGGRAVLEIADQALYAAKAAGRDTFRLAGSVSSGASGGPQPAAPAAGR